MFIVSFSASPRYNEDVAQRTFRRLFRERPATLIFFGRLATDEKPLQHPAYLKMNEGRHGRFLPFLIPMSNEIQERKTALFDAGGVRLSETDPAYTEFFSQFAFGEVPKDVTIPAADAALAVQAVLLGAQGLEVFTRMLPVAVGSGVKPEELREVVYQATAYCGIGRVLPFVQSFEAFVRAHGITLSPDEPLDRTEQQRMESGEAVQVEAFGDGMKGFATSGAPGREHINRWLSANCFGDYYTRPGLDLRRREMITFCFLAGQGGCEPQLTSHARGNMHVGNDKAYLIGVVSACLPYIGYPRSLNALACIEEAAK